MNNLTEFQKALAHDLENAGGLTIKNLSAKEAYFPYIKMLFMVYLLLVSLSTLAITCCALVGSSVNVCFLLELTKHSLLFNLIPLFFLACAAGQKYILWNAIKSELKSAPFIKKLMRHYLKCFLVLYVTLLILATVLMDFSDFEFIFFSAIVFGTVIFIFFINMETQRLSQSILSKQAGKLVSRILALNNSDNAL